MRALEVLRELLQGLTHLVRICLARAVDGLRNLLQATKRFGAFKALSRQVFHELIELTRRITNAFVEALLRHQRIESVLECVDVVRVHDQGVDPCDDGDANAMAYFNERERDNRDEKAQRWPQVPWRAKWHRELRPQLRRMGERVVDRRGHECRSFYLRHLVELKCTGDAIRESVSAIQNLRSVELLHRKEIAEHRTDDWQRDCDCCPDTSMMGIQHAHLHHRNDNSESAESGEAQRRGQLERSLNPHASYDGGERRENGSKLAHEEGTLECRRKETVEVSE